MAADANFEVNDVQYTITCPKNSLGCEDSTSRSPFGYLMFSIVLAAWLLRDIVGAFKLFILALWKKNVDFLFASMIIFMVTLYSALTSVYCTFSLC